MGNKIIFDKANDRPRLSEIGPPSALGSPRLSLSFSFLLCFLPSMVLCFWPSGPFTRFFFHCSLYLYCYLNRECNYLYSD